MWQGLCALSDDTSLTALRYIFHISVSDEITTEIIKRAYPNPRGVKVLMPNGPPQEAAAFRALLLTPDGVEVPFMLMNHKKALGRKTIAKITIVRAGENTDPYLVWELADLDVGPSVGGMANGTGLLVTGRQSNSCDVSYA